MPPILLSKKIQYHLITQDSRIKNSIITAALTSPSPNPKDLTHKDCLTNNFTQVYIHLPSLPLFLHPTYLTHSQP